MIDKKWLGETSVSHHSFFAFPTETLWNSDPYFLYIIFFKGLVLFVRGRFSKYFRTPKGVWLFYRCFYLIAFNCRDRQPVEMGSMKLGGCCPAPRMHIFAVLSSVVCCFFLDFQILCPLYVVRACTALCFKSDQMGQVCFCFLIHPSLGAQQLIGTELYQFPSDHWGTGWEWPDSCLSGMPCPLLHFHLLCLHGSATVVMVLVQK